MAVMKYLQDERSSIRNVGVQDRQTLAMYGQTIRATVDDARAQQQQASAAATKLSTDNVAVKMFLSSGAIYKDKDGVWKLKPGAEGNEFAQQYAELRNYERDQQALAESGVGELNQIKQKLLPEVQDDGVQDLYSSIFGENGGRAPTQTTTPG